MLALHVSTPTDEALLYRHVCYRLFNATACRSAQLSDGVDRVVQKHASIYTMYFNVVYAIPSVCTAIVYAAWSEKYSHKIPMILVNVGCILTTLVKLLVSISEHRLAVEVFFAAHLLFSLFGSTSTMFSIVYNYLTHVTTGKNRSEHIATIESCLMFGSTIGLVLSGVLLELVGFQLNFLLVIGIHLVTIAYIRFCLEEVIPRSKDVFVWKEFYGNLAVWDDVKESMRVLFKRRKCRRRRYLLWSLAGLLCSM